MSHPSPQPGPRIILTIWMVLSQLLAAGTLLVWAFAALTSILFFDSQPNPSGMASILVFLAYPIWPVGLSIAAWVAYARRKNVWAAIFSGLSAAPILLELVAMLTLLAGPGAVHVEPAHW